MFERSRPPPRDAAFIRDFSLCRCLVFVEKGRRGKWTKVRSLSVLGQMYMCRNIRSGCVKKDECIFAHSTIELKTWRVQRDTGIFQILPTSGLTSVVDTPTLFKTVIF